VTRVLTKLNVFALLVLLVAPGCRSYAANVVKMNAEGGNIDIQVINEGLQDDLQLVTGRVAYEGDILVGWVTIRNQEDEKLPYEYRWRWFDADNKEIAIGGGGEAWAKKFANPLEEVEVDGHATREGAVRTEFQLRYAAE
jgi:hypothetical protein